MGIMFTVGMILIVLYLLILIKECFDVYKGNQQSAFTAILDKLTIFFLIINLLISYLI